MNGQTAANSYRQGRQNAFLLVSGTTAPGRKTALTDFLHRGIVAHSVIGQLLPSRCFLEVVRMLRVMGLSLVLSGSYYYYGTRPFARRLEP